MWPIVLPLWIVGAAIAGVIGELARAESPRWALLGRLGFAVALAVSLGGTVAVFDVQYASAQSAGYVSRGGWWVVTVAGWVLVLATGLALLRAAVRRALHLAATATGAAAFAIFPLAWAPQDRPWRIALPWIVTAVAVPVALAVSAATPRRASAATRPGAPG